MTDGPSVSQLMMFAQACARVAGMCVCIKSMLGGREVGDFDISMASEDFAEIITGRERDPETWDDLKNVMVEHLKSCLNKLEA